MPHRLVLLRHGQSTWNLANRFTGWVDEDLSDKGREEAAVAGDLLAREGFAIDRAFTSVLKRAIRTLWIALDRMDRMWIPVERTWLLNERHYGALTGQNKQEAVEQFGAEQVQIWRRSFDTPPPPLSREDPRHPRFDPRYAALDPELLPDTESLSTTCDRVIPCWNEMIAPEIRKGRTVLVAAHGNSLRALVMHLDGLSAEEISNCNIPTGFPLVYELDDDLRKTASRYLGDPDAVAAAISGVAGQTQR
jgi:2,3-bisphosphoglycerate-dependent phosphoglycerate mutase